jgi:hypothetical protein
MHAPAALRSPRPIRIAITPETFEDGPELYASSPRNGAFAPYDLLLKATRGVTIAVVSSRKRKRRQPGLATDGPEFVGWPQLVRGIQGSYVQLRFRLRCVRTSTSRSGDRKTARRSRVFRHRSSPHPDGTPRKREKGPHDACGIRDSEKGRPGMGVSTPQFGRCPTGNRR